MLGWPTGISKFPAKNSIAGELFSTADCQGDELHILDCDTEIVSHCETLAEIQCGPGFPLTLRIENPIQESLASVSSFGHPVVDTTGRVI